MNYWKKGTEKFCADSSKEYEIDILLIHHKSKTFQEHLCQPEIEADGEYDDGSNDCWWLDKNTYKILRQGLELNGYKENKGD